MIVKTRRGPNGRNIVRVDKPVMAVGSAWNQHQGHYLSLGPFGGQDGVYYSIELSKADVETMIRSWQAGAEKRRDLDKELSR